MAHYRIIVFRKPKAAKKNKKPFTVEDLSAVDGYSYNGQIILVDTIRWLAPDLSKENQMILFRRLLDKAIAEAAENDYVGTLETWLL